MSAKKTLLIGGAAIALLLLFSQKARDDVSSLFNQLSQWFDTTVIAKVYLSYQALQQAGLSASQLKLALSAVMFETGAFSSLSNVADQDNNYSGIEWINNSSIQKNATQGTPFPAGEAENAYYAHFATVNDWAVDYVRILNNPPYYPIASATDIDSFATLLEENGYYTGSESDYAAGILHYWNIFTAIGL